MAFRITPILGPGLTQTGADYYWDTIAGKTVAGTDVGPSYQLGTVVTGSDGHDYVHVTAHDDLSEDDAIGITEGTWVSKSGTGYTAPVAVKSGNAFHARKD